MLAGGNVTDRSQEAPREPHKVLAALLSELRLTYVGDVEPYDLACAKWLAERGVRVGPTEPQRFVGTGRVGDLGLLEVQRVTFEQQVAEALRQVPHTHGDCDLAGPPTYYLGRRHVCTCDREARIAARVARAMYAGMWCAVTHGHAFDETAALRVLNEGTGLSSDLILAAECELRDDGRGCGPDGMLTYVFDRRIRSSNPGYCFKRAGWKVRGRSADGRKTLLHKPFLLAGVAP